MVCIGFVGYTETVNGLKAVTTVWAAHLSDEVRRRFYKNWYRAKKKAFTKYQKNFYSEDKKMSDKIEAEIKRAKDYCQVVRAICHTQVSKAKIGQKKAHIMEIQVNGGSVPEKVDFVTKMFEQSIPVATVFSDNEMIDTIGVTKGRGWEGVITRWGVTRLPRKTHRGLRAQVSSATTTARRSTRRSTASARASRRMRTTRARRPTSPRKRSRRLAASRTTAR